MDEKTTPRKCPYCGRPIRKNQRPFVKRGYYADGTDFVGHKSCYAELMAPAYSRSNRDIGIGR